jgi:glucokinase
MIAIGIDIGGTSIKGASINDKGIILDRFSLDVNKDDQPEKTIGDLCDVINEFVKTHKYDEPIEGIGIGSPGVINHDRGEILSSPNLPTWEHFYLRDFVESRTGYKVYINNDANVAALGEAVFGSGKEYNNAIMLTLGTGVGSGIIMNKRIYDGNLHQGAEIGHMVIRVGGRPCGCGRRGCLETYASATALINDTKKALEKDPKSLMADEIKLLGKLDARVPFNAMRKGDKAATRVVKGYIKSLSEGILNICNIFRPEVVILSGGVANEGDFLIKRIKRYMKKYDYGMIHSPFVDVKQAKLGYDSGKIGAACLVFSK